MSIVIDANAFSAVFDQENSDHAEFKDVKSWIESGRGFLIYGGAKYKKEVIQSYRRARLIRLLRDAGKAFEIRENAVEEQLREITRRVDGSGCNDQHVIALLIAANCALLCSKDKESFPHIKNRKIYPKKFPKVRIYTGLRNRDLLVRSSRKAITNVA